VEKAALGKDGCTRKLASVVQLENAIGWNRVCLWVDNRVESGENTGEATEMLKTDTLQITPELLVFLAEIDEFKGAWRALGSLAPERLKALRRVATIESVGSSTRIEDGKLTDREVERLLSNSDRSLSP
jgi:hypothetical protein